MCVTGSKVETSVSDVGDVDTVEENVGSGLSRSEVGTLFVDDVVAGVVLDGAGTSPPDIVDEIDSVGKVVDSLVDRTDDERVVKKS